MISCNSRRQKRCTWAGVFIYRTVESRSARNEKTACTSPDGGSTADMCSRKANKVKCTISIPVVCLLLQAFESKKMKSAKDIKDNTFLQIQASVAFFYKLCQGSIVLPTSKIPRKEAHLSRTKIGEVPSACST